MTLRVAEADEGRSLLPPTDVRSVPVTLSPPLPPSPLIFRVLAFPLFLARLRSEQRVRQDQSDRGGGREKKVSRLPLATAASFQQACWGT